ncbi:hypothetical protein TNCV_3099031 [Trichonephila clavipes]|nr:hypothetical protein TNCV_3099031 [Trichonephila clavipes]
MEDWRGGTVQNTLAIGDDHVALDIDQVTRTTPDSASHQERSYRRVNDTWSPCYGDSNTPTGGLWVTDLITLNHGQVTRTTLELIPPILTSTPYRWEEV